jgi:hypothetical protein
MQARSRARRQRIQGGGRTNNAGHGATPLRTGLAWVPGAAAGRESGTDSRESA